MLELLGYLFVSIPFIGAMVLGVLLPLLGLNVARKPSVGLFLFSMAVLQVMLLPGLPGLPLGVSLYFGDLVTVCLLFGGIFRFSAVKDAPRLPVSIFPFAFFLFVSFVLGVGAYKTLSGVAFRPYFWCLASAFYFGSFRFKDELLTPALKCFVYLGGAMALVAIFRWSGVLPSGGELLGASADSLDNLGRTRVIDSAATLMLSQLAFALLVCAPYTRMYSLFKVAMPLLFGMVLVLQHRSVWVAALAGFVVWFIFSKTKKKINGGSVVLIIVALGVLVSIAMMTGAGSEVGGQIANSAERAYKGEDTAQARLDTWAYVWDRYKTGGPKAWLTGFPFGTSMERVVATSNGGTQVVGFQAHNFFMQVLFNTGILGLLSAVTFLGVPVIMLYRRLKESGGEWFYVFPLVLLIEQLAYFIFYNMTIGNALMFGLVLSSCYEGAKVSKDRSNTYSGVAAKKRLQSL